MNNGAYSKTYIFYIIQLKPKLEKERADGTTSVQDWSQSWVFLQKNNGKDRFSKDRVEPVGTSPMPISSLFYILLYTERRSGTWTTSDCRGLSILNKIHNSCPGKKRKYQKPNFLQLQVHKFLNINFSYIRIAWMLVKTKFTN